MKKRRVRSGIVRTIVLALALALCITPAVPVFAADPQSDTASGQAVQKAWFKKANKYRSSTKYLILVPRKQHKVLIFKGKKGSWKLKKEYRCTTGKKSTPTPKGVYTVKAKGKYFNTGRNGRCWYYTQFRGNYLFHSVIYKRAKKPRRILDGRLGISASHGCVRLTLKEAKWIYKKIPRGTKVVIY